ncbi:L-threonylcarbamoyladenylate synthase [Psychrobacillus sp. OK028]|uniref:L-threonylcarbamoyladenylate synthase n=1 Tax=Psychrobacillus sp. OK028 TaxID=1884359 RepID=UPI00088502F6|nr:L-threonylcarbamoyladenylate synthase [Psychrobacillus sp. OK028]SDN24155.1 L-threonylcarbamoyladenylate synthase [Psychrobacillus sp. OK028]
MKTIISIVDNLSADKFSYAQAVDLLTNGEVVAFPTETVYGLGAIATSEVAVAKIFEAKGRPQDNPLIVHIGSKEEIKEFTHDIPKLAEVCMETFWPGPLTLILPLKAGSLAENVSAGLPTVGVRMPEHPVALELLKQLKQPVAAPSANKSGKPSPTKAAHVYHDLNGKIPLILDGGTTGIGLESTVIDFVGEIPTILRPGGITKEMLEKVIGPVGEAKPTDHEEAPRAPGMKYAHYAPDSPVFLIEASIQKVQEAVEKIHNEQKKVAIIASDSFNQVQVDYFFSLGNENQLDDAAHLLYQALRDCDETDVEIILVPVLSKKGVGRAIMNRLEKAANGNWFRN